MNSAFTKQMLNFINTHENNIRSSHNDEEILFGRYFNNLFHIIGIFENKIAKIRILTIRGHDPKFKPSVNCV